MSTDSPSSGPPAGTVAQAAHRRVARLVRLRPEWVFAVWTMIFGTFSIVAMPPLYVSDEWVHFLRAYDLSRGRIRPVAFDQGWPASRVPASINALVENYGDVATGGKESVAKLWRLWQVPFHQRPAVRHMQWGTVPNAPIAYVPSAVGIALARKVGLGPLGLLYAARLATLLACTALIFSAIRAMPFLKYAMTALALLPSCVSLYASCSGDGMLIASSWLMIALVFESLARSPSMSVGRTLLVGSLGVIAGLCKLPYVALGFLVFMVPDRGRWRRGILMLIVIAAPAAAWSANAQHLVPAEHSIPGYRCSPAEQMQFVRERPLDFAWILVDSVLDQGFSFLMALPVLAPQLAPQNSWVSAATMLLVLGLALLERDLEHSPSVDPSTGVRMLCAVVASLCLSIIYACMYLWWSEIRGTRVVGISPRYFLPLFPLVLVVFRGMLRGAWMGPDRALALIAIAPPAILVVAYVRLLNQTHSGLDTVLLGPSASALTVTVVAGCTLSFAWRALASGYIERRDAGLPMRPHYIEASRETRITLET